MANPMTLWIMIGAILATITLCLGICYKLKSNKETALISTLRSKIASLEQAERTILEQRAQMDASSRMAALGQMAGGVAHEINNPLAAISGFNKLCDKLFEKYPPDRETYNKYSERIKVNLLRIDTIVRGLRSISRDRVEDLKEAQSVSSIIKNTLTLCTERFNHHSIQLEVNCPDDISIECNPSQISQVLINLLNNAYDAVESLGTRWVKIVVKDHREQIEIRVVDSGSKIPDEIADKLMTPFFTTKPVNKGTGLGLSISQRIVTAHDGRFYFDASEPNTTFVIELPKHQSQKNMAA